MASRTFPDYFYSKESLPFNVTPLNVKNGTYYALSIHEDRKTQEIPQNNYLPPYEDNEEGMIDCMEVEDAYEIVQTKSGKFMTSFYVPGPMQAFIIGPKGKRLKSLEEKSRCQIKIPKINEKGDVKIMGNNERSVASARNQISMIVLNKREKMPATHFLSIPVMNSEIQQNFEKFKNEVLNLPPTRGVNESIFQNPKKLHLTITTFSLLDETEISEMIQSLKVCQNDIIYKLFPKNQKYNITVKGLEIMNDDPSEVHVLYGKVQLDETQKFQQLSNDIVHYFYRKGLIKKQYESVKLHVTLMNSIFNKENENSKRNTFDATDILKNYDNYYFGRAVFDSVQLSVRFTSSENGFYESAFTVPI
ncbi:unnamed protein product [Brassicogethes aeneus]|uniref:K Homology domain-containing protein n=1 Tax=Brassicogethes aeneus TaxID=1431903 RepID=A0A9P0AXD0_BRAAE|nr:unnamed protein product [Brassicogethes aeneus]